MKRSLPLALTLLFSLACGGLPSTTDPTEGPGATDPLPDEITRPKAPLRQLSKGADGV